MSISTLLDVIGGALTIIGQLGRGQTVAPEDGALGLTETNLLLSQASTKRLMLPYVGTRTYTLVANTADYTVGPSGLFVAPRPTLIESAQAQVAPGVDAWIPMNVLDKAKWDGLIDRSAVGLFPISIYPEYAGFPNLAFHIHPKPSSGSGIRLGAWEALTQFTSVFDVIAMPPAYEEWIKATLAVLMAPSYDQPVPGPVLQRQAKAEQAVMEINAQSIGGSLGTTQSLVTPNVGQPIPPAPPAAGGQ